MDENDAKLTRYADGEMPDDERAAFEELLGRDGALRARVDETRDVGTAVRAALLAEREPPAAELFNGHVAKRIAEGDGQGAPPDEEQRRNSGHRRQRRTAPALGVMPWLVAAAASVVAMLAVFRGAGEPGAEGAVTGVYTPDPAVWADVYFDRDAEATVILLEGLAAVPDEREVKPYSVASHEVDHGSGRTVFYDEHDPERALFVLLGAGSKSGERSLLELE